MDLNLLKTFVIVVDSGSMTAAARRLKMPISRVSRAIARLEQDIGSSLILRTTRSFQVTDTGLRLFQETRPLLQKLNDVQELFSENQEEVKGLVRITCPEDIGSALVAKIIAEISTYHAGISFDLNLTEENLDLVKTKTDLAIRIGHLKDSSLKAKRLGTFHLSCVAAPSYLEKSGRPKAPTDLLQHDCIHLILGPSDTNKGWNLSNGKRSTLVPIQPRYTANHTGAAIEIARANRGICMAPLALVLDDLRRGTLEHVLSDWTLHDLPIHLVYPPQRILSRKVRVVADLLESRLSKYFGS